MDSFSNLPSVGSIVWKRMSDERVNCYTTPLTQRIARCCFQALEAKSYFYLGYIPVLECFCAVGRHGFQAARVSAHCPWLPISQLAHYVWIEVYVFRVYLDFFESIQENFNSRF